MAIVQTIQHRWGGVILIDDSAYRGVPEAELERRRQETRRVAGRIAYKIACAEAMKKESEAGRRAGTEEEDGP